MKPKVIYCLAACFFLAGALRAQDNARQATDTTIRQATDTAVRTQDSTAKPIDSGIPFPDSTSQVKDTSTQVKDAAVQVKDNPAQATDTATQVKDTPKDVKPAQDTTTQDGDTPPRGVDTRWFISPLLKGQFQDYGMLEKNRKGYLSDANTLPIEKRGNLSFAASAYKNITGRLSVSADIGLSFGHVTSNNVLISQTPNTTYNLLNATVYYHLLPASYRLQPYVMAGINDLINNASYLTAPVGIGAKFNGRKIMVMGQLAYGYGVSKNNASTTMYSVGIYLPIKNKKQKQLDADDNSPYNRHRKDDDKKKDSTSKNNGNGVVNNIYITINMDSVLRAKGLSGNDDDPLSGRSRGGRRGNAGDNDNDNGGDGGGETTSSGKRKSGLQSFSLEDFSFQDFKVDTIDGHPVIRFVVYFNFNDYSLTTKAFSSIDKVIDHLKRQQDLSIEIKGYTDDVGSDEYNNFLSRRRAKMVYDYMNSRGVPSDLMKAKAYGKDNPVGDNKDPNQAWLNRRAEIIVREK